MISWDCPFKYLRYIKKPLHTEQVNRYMKLKGLLQVYTSESEMVVHDLLYMKDYLFWYVSVQDCSSVLKEFQVPSAGQVSIIEEESCRMLSTGNRPAPTPSLE